MQTRSADVGALIRESERRQRRANRLRQPRQGSCFETKQEPAPMSRMQPCFRSQLLELPGQEQEDDPLPGSVRWRRKQGDREMHEEEGKVQLASTSKMLNPPKSAVNFSESIRFYLC